MSRMSSRLAAKNEPIKPAAKEETPPPQDCTGATGHLRANVGGREVLILTRGAEGAVEGEGQAAAVIDVRNELNDDGEFGVESSIAHNRGARVNGVVQRAQNALPTGGACTVVFVCSAGKVRSVTAACGLYKALLQCSSDEAFNAFKSHVKRQLWQDQIVKGSIG